MEAKELRKQLRISGDSFENTVFDLVVGDKVHAVIPRELSLHPGEINEVFYVISKHVLKFCLKFLKRRIV